MDIKHIEAFVHVAKTGSFSKTAERLYLTQPSVSALIKALENELRCPLFDRSHRSICVVPIQETLNIKRDLDLIFLKENRFHGISQLFLTFLLNQFQKGELK